MMKLLHEGFEPEVQAPVNIEAKPVAPRKRRVQLQMIRTDNRLFHAYRV
jgi:hypothetical protein